MFRLGWQVQFPCPAATEPWIYLLSTKFAARRSSSKYRAEL